MIKTVVKALEGFEAPFEEVMSMKNKLEEDKKVAIEEAIKEVESKFEDRAAKIDKVLETVSVVEEIEVPDEEPELMTTEPEIVAVETAQETLY